MSKVAKRSKPPRGKRGMRALPSSRRPAPMDRIDPTRTATLRRQMVGRVRAAFSTIKARIVKLIAVEDALGLRPSTTFLSVANANPDGCNQYSGPGCSVSPKVAAEIERVRGSFASKTLTDDERSRVHAWKTGDSTQLRSAELLRAVEKGIVTKPITVYRAGGTSDSQVLEFSTREGWTKDTAESSDRPVTAIHLQPGDKALFVPIATEHHIVEMGVLLPPKTMKSRLTANDLWRFKTSREKVEEFRSWLRTQVGEVLTSSDQEDLWARYAEAGYRKGAGRAFDDVRKPYAKGYAAREPGGTYRTARGGRGTEREFYDGTKDEFLRQSFARPVAVERVQQLAGRSFDDLEGIAEDMVAKVSRTLSDGLVEGKGADDVARDLAEQVDVSRDRAETVARTEIVRAHAEGQLDSMEALGVEEVGVAVEWLTAGPPYCSDLTSKERRTIPCVCKKCEALEGVVLKIDEARNLLPRHPNCRCAWIPANVGEGEEGQKDTKAKIDAAMADAGLDEDVDVSADRPESILNARVANLDATGNVFCPTGPGGGVDATCSPVSVTKSTDDLFMAKFESGGKEFSFKAEREHAGEVDWGVSFVAGDMFTRLAYLQQNDPDVSAIDVLNKVGQSIMKFVREKQPRSFGFSADSREKGRVKTYDKLAVRLGRALGYSVVSEDYFGIMKGYRLTKQSTNNDLVRNWCDRYSVVANSNPEGCNQYKECGTGGGPSLKDGKIDLARYAWRAGGLGGKGPHLVDQLIDEGGKQVAGPGGTIGVKLSHPIELFHSADSKDAPSMLKDGLRPESWDLGEGAKSTNLGTRMLSEGFTEGEHEVLLKVTMPKGSTIYRDDFPNDPMHVRVFDKIPAKNISVVKGKRWLTGNALVDNWCNQYGGDTCVGDRGVVTDHNPKTDYPHLTPEERTLYNKYSALHKKLRKAERDGSITEDQRKELAAAKTLLDKLAATSKERRTRGDEPFPLSRKGGKHDPKPEPEVKKSGGPTSVHPYAQPNRSVGIADATKYAEPIRKALLRELDVVSKPLDELARRHVEEKKAQMEKDKAAFKSFPSDEYNAMAFWHADQLRVAAREIEKARIEVVKKVLAAPDPATRDELRGIGRISEGALMKSMDAENFLRAICSKNIAWTQPVLLQYQVKGPNFRARQIPNDRSVGVYEPSSSHPHAKDSTIQVASTDDRGVYVHEIGHAIEHQNPEILHSSLSFLRMRREASGESIVKLSTLIPGRRYRRDERGFGDDFAKAFGKSGPYCGKDYGGQATEILSMGLQKLYEDPKALAEKDPEYFAYVVATIHGKYRK